MLSSSGSTGITEAGHGKVYRVHRIGCSQGVDRSGDSARRTTWRCTTSHGFLRGTLANTSIASPPASRSRRCPPPLLHAGSMDPRMQQRKVVLAQRTEGDLFDRHARRSALTSGKPELLAREAVWDSIQALHTSLLHVRCQRGIVESADSSRQEHVARYRRGWRCKWGAVEKSLLGNDFSIAWRSCSHDSGHGPTSTYTERTTSWARTRYISGECGRAREHL